MKLKDWPEAKSPNERVIKTMAKLAVRRKEQIERLKRENEKLRKRIAELEAELEEKK